MSKGEVMRGLKHARVLPLVAVLALALPAFAGKAKKVAVIDFDDSRVRARAGEIFGADVPLGRDLAAQVAEFLRLDATYVLIDQATIDRAREKKKLATLDLSVPADVRAFGKAIKADAVLVGSVTLFGKYVRKSRRRGSKRMLTRAAIVVAMRLIETKTGKVLVKENVYAESRGNGRILLGSDAFSGFGDGPVDLGREDFHSTPMGQAVARSIEKVSSRVIGAKEELGVSQFSITATIASVSGRQATLNIGAGMGLKVGDRLPVRRIVGEEKVSGIVLSRTTRRIAVIEITALDDLSTTARIVYGTGVKIGDEVRIVMN